MKRIKLMIIGFGTIGKGIARVLIGKRNFLRRRYNTEIQVSAICERKGSIVDEGGINLKNALELAWKGKLKEHRNWTSEKALKIIREVDADIVLELTPGNIKNGEPGLSHIKAALNSGKNVVTSNKAPLALKFSELNKTANSNNLHLRYEATVGGAIPIINLYRETLQINEINSIYGILNGTSNFILSKMVEEGIDIDSALKEAQEIGIVERNPDYDIDGIDTASKVVILANSLMNKEVSFKDVKITGIKGITQEAVELAKKHNYVIKLIGDVGMLDVSPRLIHVNHPLNVSGSLNAIMIESDIAKNITLIGHGAGPLETSSSLFSDILKIVENIKP